MTLLALGGPPWWLRIRDDAQPRRDFMHPLNYAQGKVEVTVPGLATALETNPQRDIISAVDSEAWVASLPESAQDLLAMRQAGSTLGVSP